MLTLSPFCFCTNSVPGHDVTAALDVAKLFGFSCVELSAINGASEQIVAELISDEYIRNIQNLLDERGLTCVAVSGHCDMTDPQQFPRLLKKIEFAGKIGAKWFNTRSGPKNNLQQFLTNVGIAGNTAKKYGVTLNLESYGDIVGPAAECGDTFAMLDDKEIKYNYDPGNTFRFKKGDISIADDLRNAAVIPSYVHLKDVSLRDGFICHEAIGAGQLEYPEIFDVLEEYTPKIPCGLEIPLSFRINASDLSFDYLNPTMDQVLHTIESSLEFISKYARINY